MFERLSITNFAVARSVLLEPAPGLNVVTGETGAGKSLVVDALAFVCGGRRGREVIATGAERATVEAVFRFGAERIVLERSIGLSGRSTVRIGGEQSSIEDLQEIAARTVDIHGQSEQLGILRPAIQLTVLDQFAGAAALRDEVTTTVRELRRIRREAQALASDVHERERLIDQLRFESDEIAAAGLARGEDTALRDEQLRLSSTGRRREDVEVALAALEAAPVGDAVRAVDDLASRDSEAADLAALAATAETAAHDLARGLRRYREAIDDDPGRLAAVQERLDLIARLRRKYGETVDEILEYARRADERLGTLTGAGASLEGLQAEEARLLALLGERASGLSEMRRAAAGDLVRAIADELAHLGMANASLSVGFACDDAPDGPVVAQPDYEVVITDRPAGSEGEPLPRAFTESGIDRIEFLASFNPGETPRPLSAVASGGETSRFLLALTTVLGAAAEPRLVVLDEVDEGVGGRAGALVGEALARLAERHQVFCITHLPQVAAFGTTHFVVTKQTDGARAWSTVERLEPAGRVDELASMLGGRTQANLAAAAELLSSPRRRQSSLTPGAIND